jgi:predicted deacetylase
MHDMKPVIISVHDVMPETLENVENILKTVLAGENKSNILLLIVPGLEWSQNQIQRLHALQGQGYEFAGHGWVHCIDGIKTTHHQFHSRLLSRNAAEHLSKSEDQIVSLLKNNYNWFKDHDFKLPNVYVPPAWAMGRIKRSSLKRLPFNCYEYTSGLFDVREGKFHRLPLVGFEADTRARAWFLRIWNRLNYWYSKDNKPLRVSIHPFDLNYRLAGQLTRILNQSKSIHWTEVA